MKLFSIDNYLSTVDEKDRVALESLRAYIHELVPGVEEKISYGLAAFYYKGKYLVAFGAFKSHLSLFPGGIVDIFKPRLTGHKLTKGSMHFTAEKPIDKKLIKEIVELRKSTIDNN